MSLRFLLLLWEGLGGCLLDDIQRKVHNKKRLCIAQIKPSLKPKKEQKEWGNNQSFIAEKWPSVKSRNKKKKRDPNETRGGRLARRARSFKDDFLGRINQMRSPSGNRAASPCKNTKNKNKTVPDTQDESPLNRPGKDVDTILRSVRLLSTDLRYFQDVVEKNILEMLPGSATVVLETVLNIHSALRESLVNEQSSLMLSASNQVYQTLANLIRWSDNILLYGEKAVEKENVVEVVQAVREAVKSLVQLSLDRLQHKDLRNSNDFSSQHGILSSPKPESNSSYEDSILNCDFQLDSAPPLPPKKKLVNATSVNCDQTRIIPVTDNSNLCGSCGSINTELNSLCTVDWTSPCSQSPENLTPISKSSASSLDSNLNNSVDDLSFMKYKYLKCSDTQEFLYSKQHFLPGFTSQTYNCELSSYTSTMTTASTSISLHSNGVSENTQEFLESVNEIRVQSNESSFQLSTNSQSEPPPALPVKLRKLRNLTISQYDNMPQFLVSDLDPECEGHSPQCPHVHSPQSWLGSSHAPLCPHHPGSKETNENGKPPPLPPKERTIRAYMQMFGSYSQPSESEFLRHSVHTYKVVQANWQQIELSFMQQPSFNSSYITSTEESSSVYDVHHMQSSSGKNIEEEEEIAASPPSIPPKKNRVSSSSRNTLKSDEFNSCAPATHSPVGPTDESASPSFAQKNYEKASVLLPSVDGENSAELQGALDELDPTEYLIMKKSVCL
ncbi:rap guanine nucleotide exchange factor 1-like isoform X3 [Stegodyphus dumicola]|uniref:rap guanine nucleotide exchange factor 1-like isoform X3 n=1 Tax=Stegodyphus dumicola TaxID=202533 RepID=UPI0015AEA7E5|nr:rap guanine nucleotide exchange factor 1-like isoform X3 [Stegodyphus dumicola]